MIEQAFHGTRRYWTTLAILGGIIGVGALCYLRQLSYGLGITGLSRDVTWGFYIAQFTFLVGVAASAVMVVLPYYLHHYKPFQKIIILGEFLSISAVVMCLLFILADLGKPMRALNMLLHPTPNSLLFWDMVVLNGYLLLNIIIGWTSLSARRKDIAPPAWIKPLIFLSIPWAVSIHTVTAFIYNGIPGRSFWLTAILAPRFLASAFASGPSLLILMCLLVKKYTKFDPGREPLHKLAQIATYAMSINIFFILLELFTVFYSQIPEHMDHFRYLFFGLEGKHALVPWIWFSLLLGLGSVIMALHPATRNHKHILLFSSLGIFLSVWIDKGLGMVITGFIPSPLGHITEYCPSAPELFISLGIWAIGGFILTVLYKVATSEGE